MDWAPALIELFNEFKNVVISSLVLAIFDPGEETLLKTDWSTEGMGCIFMQPADDE